MLYHKKNNTTIGKRNLIIMDYWIILNKLQKDAGNRRERRINKY